MFKDHIKIYMHALIFKKNCIEIVKKYKSTHENLTKMQIILLNQRNWNKGTTQKFCKTEKSRNYLNNAKLKQLNE